MIYEKAEGDLESFMYRHPNPQESRCMDSIDLAQQLLGLLSALAAMHGHYSVSNDTLIMLSEEIDHVYDIRPNNLLVFVDESHGREKYSFRLSDFSYSKRTDPIVSVSGTNRNSWKTIAKMGPTTYRAPESVGKCITSPSYLWSLGCVFLELLVWHLEGYVSLQTFRSARECQIRPGGREDEGFYFEATEDEVFKLRNAVLRKIESISTLCQGPLRAILDTVQEMLQIDPRRRPTAEALMKGLSRNLGNDGIATWTGESNEISLPRDNDPNVSTYESDFDSNLNQGNSSVSASGDSTTQVRETIPGGIEHWKSPAVAASATESYIDTFVGTTLIGTDSGDIAIPGKTYEVDLLSSHDVAEDCISLVSNDEDIGSQTSAAARAPAEIYAVRAFGAFLGELKDLIPLHEALLKRLGHGRFVRNYRRVLKKYVLRLQEPSVARSHIEDITVRVLTSRQNRISIAQRIIEALLPDEEGLQKHFDPLDYQPVEQESLMSWVNSQVIRSDVNFDNAFVRHDDDDHHHHHDDDSENSDDSSDEGHSTGLQSDFDTILLSFVDKAKESLRSNINVLKLELRLLALSTSLRDLVDTVPKEDIRILYANDTTYTNTVKAFIEDHTSIEWDWWPLQPRVPEFLQDKQCLIQWQVSTVTCIHEEA